MYRILLLLAVLAAPAWAAPAAAPPPPPAPPQNDALESILNDLDGIESEMTANSARIVELKAEIVRLKSLGKSAADQIEAMEVLVEAHAERVRQLGERYTKVLVMAQKLKKDLEMSATMNYVFGGTALVAILVAVGEGLALAQR